MKITKAMRAGTDPVSFFDILEQGKWWRTKDLQWVRVRDMELRHSFFTLGLLERKARETATAYTMAPVFWTCPDDVQSELDRIIDHPEQWMRSTELYQSLLHHVTTEALK